MPYNNIEELPPALRKHLPDEAKKLYLAAYNTAWSRSVCAHDHGIGASPEDIAHREAWSAVRDKYRKLENEWVRNYG